MPDFYTATQTFSAIYENKVWGGGSGASGPDLTRPYMRMLADFVHNNAVTSVVDVGCGDWQFSTEMDWSGIRYHGFDVVESVVEANKASFASDTISFQTMCSINDLPRADLVVCKDVLQHLPNQDVNEYLDYFSSCYKYAIVTNDIFPDAYTNADIRHGAGRALRLDQAPFNRRIAVLMRWTIAWQEQAWIKDACLLLGGSAGRDPHARRNRYNVDRLKDRLDAWLATRWQSHSWHITAALPQSESK
jgi:SAM-dependent methyltransferase